MASGCCFTVFAGSRHGARPEYIAATKDLGKVLAERKCSLIYGGSSAGLLGAVAQSALDYGGEVTGVIPTFFAESLSRSCRPRAHTNLDPCFLDLFTGLARRLTNLFEKWS